MLSTYLIKLRMQLDSKKRRKSTNMARETLTLECFGNHKIRTNVFRERETRMSQRFELLPSASLPWSQCLCQKQKSEFRNLN